MNKPAPDEDPGLLPFDASDALGVFGLLLIAAGIGMVNIPLALFTTGMLIYVPVVIAEFK